VSFGWASHREGWRELRLGKPCEGCPRVKALVLTLRYSGMRIGDVVGLQKAHLKVDKLFLNTQKSGSKIYVPLPKTAVEALNAIASGSPFFFWSGKGLRKSAVADWQRAIRRLFKLAEVTGHPHMFRHTFATDLTPFASPGVLATDPTCFEGSSIRPDRYPADDLVEPRRRDL
jgi:integrase